MWWRYWARLTFTCHFIVSSLFIILMCISFYERYVQSMFVNMLLPHDSSFMTSYKLVLGTLKWWFPPAFHIHIIFLHAMNFLSRIVVLICRILSVPPRVVAQSLHCPTFGGWNFENVSGRWDLLSLSFRVQEDLTRHPKNYWRIRGRVCLLHFPYIRSAYIFIAGVCI